jgi:hypothetical protein
VGNYRLSERVWVPTYRYELETSHRTGSQSWRSILGPFVHAPGKLRTVGDYSTLAEAEDACRIREAHTRLSANAFQYGGPALFFQSSLSPAQFRNQLSCVGLTPPKTENSAALADWWKHRHDDWSPQQREAIWEACDKIEFFTVSSSNPASRVYVVVEATWSWDDDSFNADPEGEGLGLIDIISDSRSNLSSDQHSRMDHVSKQLHGTS